MLSPRLRMESVEGASGSYCVKQKIPRLCESLEYGRGMGGDSIPTLPGALGEYSWKQPEQGLPGREHRDWEVPGCCGKRAGLSALGGMGGESRNVPECSFMMEP